MISTPQDALSSLQQAWPLIVDECRAVLGGELHYQAVIYHCLRVAGVPRHQIGMNVKQWIASPVTELFQAWDQKKNAAYLGGFETIPDVVIFNSDINADWRRRNYDATIRHMLLAIEIKASEREKGRIRASEVLRDIEKLAAHRDEVFHKGGMMLPVMMIIDTAPLTEERMQLSTVEAAVALAEKRRVSLLSLSAEGEKIVLAD